MNRKRKTHPEHLVPWQDLEVPATERVEVRLPKHEEAQDNLPYSGSPYRAEYNTGARCGGPRVAWAVRCFAYVDHAAALDFSSWTWTIPCRRSQ
jgi:hypothetical protein